MAGAPPSTVGEAPGGPVPFRRRSATARAVRRSRDVPAGTVGGRKQPTRTPASRQAVAAATATSGSPRITDTTADCGTSATSHMSASSRARLMHGLGPPRLVGQHPQGGQRRTDRGRRQSGVEDERAGGVDQVVTHGRRAEHHAALAAQRLRQRRRHDHVGRTGQADLVQQPPAARRRARPGRAPRRRAAAPDACRQTSCSRRSGASAPSVENTESVMTSARSSSRAASAASTASTSLCGVTTTRARDSRQRVDQRGVRVRRRRPPATPDRTARPPRRGWRCNPRRTPAPDSAPTNSASSASNCSCSSVLPVTSREPVEPAPQVRSAATPPSMTAGCCDRPEIVVGGQVEFACHRPDEAQRPAQAGPRRCCSTSSSQASGERPRRVSRAAPRQGLEHCSG